MKILELYYSGIIPGHIARTLASFASFTKYFTWFLNRQINVLKQARRLC